MSNPKRKPIISFSKLEPTPWDVAFLLIDTIQKGLLFRKPAHSKQDTNELIEHLKASFSCALDIFYPLSGRLAVPENAFFLDCNAAGAEFVHAEANAVTVEDILDAVYVPDDIVYSLFLMNGALNYEGKSRPLLAVQVTELVEGFFIGMTLNHCVGDGKCFWSFFNTWSEISRSGASTIAKPVFGREFLDGIIALPIRFPSFQHPVAENETMLIPREEPALMQRMFHFRKEKIAALKAKANAQMGTCNISSLQALMGHLWISITWARHSISNRTSTEEEASQEITRYLVLVGMRQRLHDLLSDEYTGNAVLVGAATTTVGQLLQGGLGCTAMELNKAITLQTEQEARKYLKDYVENPSLYKKGAVGKGYWLASGSSPRFDVYGNDFGWGKPVAVRSGIGNKTDGKLTVFAGAEESSIDFEACLSAQTLRILAEDEEFMQSVAV